MPTLWSDRLINLVVPSGGQTVVGLTFFGGIADLERRTERFTLLRTILRLDLMSTVRDSGEGDQLVTAGIGVGALEAVDAGVVPDPDTESEYPSDGWVWRTRYRVYASAVDDQNVDPIRIDLDLRAKRKMNNAKAYMISTNAANLGTAFPVTWTGLIRQLYLVG